MTTETNIKTRMKSSKPCPFCGGELKCRHGDDHTWILSCTNSDCAHHESHNVVTINLAPLINAKTPNEKKQAMQRSLENLPREMDKVRAWKPSNSNLPEVSHGKDQE